MEKIRRKEGEILLLRYISIFIFIISLALSDISLSFLSCIVILVYIINTQIRYYFIKEKNMSILISVFVDFLLGILIYKMFGIRGYLAFIPGLIDISVFLSNKIVVGYAAAISIFMSWYLKEISIELVSFYMLIFAIGILGQKVKDEMIRKEEAQRLYDKLRVTEEELKKANDELQGCVNTIEEITLLRERNRLSREIHDNVGHALSTIIIQLGAIEKIAKSNGEAAASMAENLAQFTRNSLQGVRDAVREMKPKEFDEYEGILSISEMIKNFEKLTGVKVKFRVSESTWKVNSEQTMVIYRIIQEFLSNSIRHGKAKEVSIFMNFKEKYLRVHLKDDGIGCNKIEEGCGLKGIRERIVPWAGDLTYSSATGNGFELAITLERVELSMKGEI